MRGLGVQRLWHQISRVARELSHRFTTLRTIVRFGSSRVCARLGHFVPPIAVANDGRSSPCPNAPAGGDHSDSDPYGPPAAVSATHRHVPITWRKHLAVPREADEG